MSIAQNFPIIAPALSLDFANVQALDPRISFARATTATYYGTRTALAEQNLVAYSQEFDNAYWTKQNIAVTANSTVAPDGTTTSETFTASAGSSAHTILRSIGSQTSNTQFTGSLFFKAGTQSFASVLVMSDANSNCWFVATVNLSTGAITQTGAGANGVYTQSSISNIGNGWYRISVTGSITVTGNIYLQGVINSTSTPIYGSFGYETWTAAGTETVLAWGAQLEQRSTVTAYTPTTTQPITNYVPVLETAASGVARFDHNPTTFESLGLLIEELRTNILLRSEEFDNAVWTKGNTTITANTAIAPDGNLTADKAIVNSGAQASVGVYQDVTALSASTAYTVSAFVKKAGAQYAVIGWIYTGAVYAAVAYDLDTLTVSRSSSAGGFTITGNSITSVGNGWYRITITATVPSTGALGRFPCVFPRNTAWTSGNPDGADTGDGYAGIFIWGAQLE